MSCCAGSSCVLNGLLTLGSLELLPHDEAAALTSCGTPVVWAPKHALLDELQAKRDRHSSLDSVVIHPAWMAVRARCAAWCAEGFDNSTITKLTALPDGSEEHGDVM